MPTPLEVRKARAIALRYKVRDPKTNEEVVDEVNVRNLANKLKVLAAAGQIKTYAKFLKDDCGITSPFLEAKKEGDFSRAISAFVNDKIQIWLS